MSNVWSIIRKWLNRNSGVVVVATAAVLLMLILIGLILHIRGMLEDELERHAENELTIKAMVIRGVLNRVEQSLDDFDDHAARFSKVTREEDVYEMLEDMATSSPHIFGCAVMFVPDFFPEKGRLFEPFVMDEDTVAVRMQLANKEHDYTSMNIYRDAIERDGVFWADPYYGGEGSHKLITTCSQPIRDAEGRLLGVLGADILLDWLTDTLDVHHNYPSSFNLLLTEEGDIISQPAKGTGKGHDVAKVVKLLKDSTTVRELSDSRRSDIIEFHDDSLDADGSIFVAFMKGYPHWQIAVICYDKEAYGKLDHVGLVTVGLLLVTLGILLLMINLFARNTKRLQQAKMEQERYASELLVAQHIQGEMLPKENTTMTHRDDLSVHGMQVPAKEVGGDIYDYYIRDEKLFFCIGDVSGKGVPSALLMAVIHALFRAASAHENNPARIMHSINEASAQGNESNMFVTLLIGVLDLPTGRLRYCNAGHDRPVMLGEQCTPLPVKANLPIGVIADFVYQGQEMMMEPESTLFLYTDGLTEAKNVMREQFREERMMTLLEQARKKGETKPDILLTKMQDAVHSFVGNAEQSDDLTMLAIRYTPQPEQSILKESLTLKNNVKEVRRLNDFVLSVTQKLQMDSSAANQVKLAVEEAVVNVIDYAYPTEVEGDIGITADANAEHLRFIITDSGGAFDPTETLTADTSLSVEERPIGGLGILLVRQLMDSINYERIDGQNVLTLTKNYKSV